MKEELLREHLEIIIGEMRRIELEHPKAKVSYDTQKQRINITYPLPRDYWELKEIKEIKINNEHMKNIKR